jgi:ADP-ribosyl-[dinitrogen reductase] hydrolase
MGAPPPAIAIPLRNCYWVLPGKVLAGEHPAGTTVDATRERLKRLMDAGVECFIDLTEPGEIKPYDVELPLGVEYLRKPIKDHSVPSQRIHMAEILDCLHDTLLSGRCAYVHCRAGIGRTGTVIGCFLAERGFAGDAALEELNRLWQQCDRSQSWASIPETESQVDFVRQWKARGVFNDRGQLAAPALTIDDDELALDHPDAPWAHLLIDPARAGGASGTTRGPNMTAPPRPSPRSTVPSSDAIASAAASPAARPLGATVAAPASTKPTGTTAQTPSAATPSPATSQPFPPSPFVSTPRRAPTSSPNTSVGASTTKAATPPLRTDPPRRTPDPVLLDAPLFEENTDPLLQPEALAAASNLRGRFHGALLGLAIGDAVAAATQYRRPGSFTPVGDMLGGGPFDLPRGGWSDDTAMALCLADSLIECNDFDARDQVERYRRWQQDGYLSATGQCLGITASSARAIAMAQWRRQAFSGSHDPTQLDPEPLSRVAPVVLFFFASSGQAIEQATEAARTTCQAPAVLEACRSLAHALHAALSGQPKAVVLERAALAAVAATSGTAAPVIGTRDIGTRDANFRVGSSAPAALTAAVAAFGATDNFRDAILYAANLGGDSDVVTAACGQLAGSYYGVKAIPTSWHNGLMRKELITVCADRLLAHAMLGMAG